MLVEGRYDLRNEIAGHDFFTWLVIAKARGMQQVVFGIDSPKTNKWPTKIVMKHMWSTHSYLPQLVNK